jgi:hypothetical protein
MSSRFLQRNIGDVEGDPVFFDQARQNPEWRT